MRNKGRGIGKAVAKVQSSNLHEEKFKNILYDNITSRDLQDIQKCGVTQDGKCLCAVLLMLINVTFNGSLMGV